MSVPAVRHPEVINVSRELFFTRLSFLTFITMLIGTWCVASPTGQTKVLIVQGLSTDQTQRDRYEKMGKAFEEAVKKCTQEVLRLTAGAADPSQESRKDTLLKKWAEMHRNCGPEDQVVMVYIGFARWDDNQFWFNLPGPDLSASELAKMTPSAKAGCVTMILGCPQAGRAIKAFSGKQRIVMAATDEAGERQDPVFVEVMSALLLKEGGSISWRSVFEGTVKGVEHWFKQAGLIQTEHAMLDDNGDGKGSESPFEGKPDGERSDEWSPSGRAVFSVDGE